VNVAFLKAPSREFILLNVSVMCGQSCVVSHVWSVMCGQSCVVSHVWSVVCGQSCVVSRVWSVVCGQSCVVSHVWSVVCGQSCVVSRVWSVMCGQFPHDIVCTGTMTLERPKKICHCHYRQKHFSFYHIRSFIYNLFHYQVVS
jgi:ABC-type uncharacterized transport system YnjBCD ATPase subunit